MEIVGTHGAKRGRERERAPLFFVSVAFKGVRNVVTPLFATLTEEFISVVSKGFRFGKFLQL
jgi:hypothetical protein